MRKSGKNQNAAPEDRMTGWTFFGLIIGIGMLGGMAAWSLTTRIDGAVIAPGMVGLETDRQVIQHLEGGIIAEILVEEGQPVKRGQVLVELDTTRDQADLNATISQITTLTVRRARLLAELNQKSFPDAAQLQISATGIEDIVAAERQLFDTRAASVTANADLLRTRKQALVAQISGLESQSLSLEADLELTQEELVSIRSLHEKGLVPVTRLLDVRRNILNLDAGLSGNAAQTKSLRAQVIEIDSELASSMARRYEEIALNLTETEQSLRELKEQHITLKDQVRRSRIVAPHDGRILNLAFHTQGGIISPGQAVMEIVPVQEQLVLLANIPVTEIDRVTPGQSATVQLTAFNVNQTPELEGLVKSVSADTLIDPATNIPYYSAEIELTKAEIDRLDGQELLPGMPANVLITTGERLVASYISRPLRDSFSSAFRDE